MPNTARGRALLSAVALLILTLTGCAQMRYEFREHPVRTTLIVGGGLAVGGYVAARAQSNGQQQRQAFWPYICNTKPESCR